MAHSQVDVVHAVGAVEQAHRRKRQQPEHIGAKQVLHAGITTVRATAAAAAAAVTDCATAAATAAAAAGASVGGCRRGCRGRCRVLSHQRQLCQPRWFLEQQPKQRAHKRLRRQRQVEPVPRRHPVVERAQDTLVVALVVAAPRLDLQPRECTRRQVHATARWKVDAGARRDSRVARWRESGVIPAWSGGGEAACSRWLPGQEAERARPGWGQSMAVAAAPTSSLGSFGGSSHARSTARCASGSERSNASSHLATPGWCQTQRSCRKGRALAEEPRLPT